MATFYDSTGATFSVTGSPVFLDATIVSIEGLPGTRELNDVTALGSIGHRFNPGLENTVFTITGMYDTTVSGAGVIGSDTAFGAYRTATTPTAFSYVPNAAGKAYTGTFMVENYEALAKVGSIVMFKVTCKVDNKVTRAT